MSMLQGGGSVLEILPPHKFSSHDIVDLKGNKSQPSSPALAHGVVFRIKDNEIIVACDEMPEDELNQPLRLEKLANEVFLLLQNQFLAASLGMSKSEHHTCITKFFLFFLIGSPHHNPPYQLESLVGIF